jgi:uncharacterized protein (TIGR02145 family)
MRTIIKKAMTLLITFSVATFAQQKGTFTDSRDKKTYKTVKMGEWVWMAENLNYNAKGSKCYGEGVNGVSADSSAKNCAKYGRLYDWATAMALPANCNSSECHSQISARHNGICPSGWHIPSNADWNTLMKFVNPSCYNNGICAGAGKKLKSKSDWKNLGNGTDDYGFSALPGGSSGYSGDSYDFVGSSGNWWSTSEDGSSYAYSRSVSLYDDVHYSSYSKSMYLYGVRCVQDNAEAEAKEKAEEKAAAEARAVAIKANTGTFTDARDKKNYKTIKIGKQIWMAENLNYDVKGGKCYNNDPDYCADYGKLYDWATAMALPANCNSNKCASRVSAKHKGICPSGWHIPSNADWDALIIKFVCSNNSDNRVCVYAGTKLKATSGWSDYSGNSGNGTDDYGFSALPGGEGGSNDKFSGASTSGNWWSTSEFDNVDASIKSIGYRSEGVAFYGRGKGSLCSVRCVKD